MAAQQKTPREAPEKDHERISKVPRRDVSRRERSRELDEVPHAGVHKSDRAHPASASVHRSEELPRVDNTRNRDRPIIARSLSRAGRSHGSTAKGPRDVPWRAGVGDSTSPGADPTPGRQSDHGGGETTGRATRAGDVKVAPVDNEEQGAGAQIGSRRRDDGEESRDASSASSRRREKEPVTTTKGDVQRDPAGDPQGREGSSRAACGRLETEKGGSPGERRRKKRKRAKPMGAPSEPERPRKERRQEPDAGAGSYEQESLETVDVADDVQSLLDAMKGWLKQEECGELTVSQNGALVALAAFRSGTPLGRYLERLVKPGSDVGAEGTRQRSLLPLPLLPDSITEMAKLFEAGEFRRLAGTWGAKKANKDKAGKEMRRVGLLIWHGLVVTLLNFLWCGGGAQGPVHRGPVSKAQKMANDRLWNLVKDFVDDNSEVKEKVPRSPNMGEWGKRLGDVRISYHGEVVEKAQKLTLDQVLPGLPPPGYGSSVPLIELCEGELKARLEDPMSNLLPEEEMPDDIPAPKVHASDEQWEKIVCELHSRGLVRPIEEPVVVKGKPLLNGSFGVVKAGKFLDDERPVLRLIMDFRATNSVTQVLTGDVRTLSGSLALQHVVLPHGRVLRLSADDLVSAFYLFALPEEWSRLMCFSGKVRWKSLGYEKEGLVHVGATVLPMGWASAVGVLQHAHRRLALRSPLAGGAGLLGSCEIRRDSLFPDLEVEGQLWSLYLDDTNLLEIMEEKVAKELDGKAPEEQERLRRAYHHWGNPVCPNKSLLRASKGEKLGAVLDGDRGLLKGATRRALESISLGMWILRQEFVPRKALQVLLGREVHTMQFGRPVFGVFDYLWKEISDGAVMLDLGPKACEEIFLAAMSQPLRVTDLRSKIHDVVTASDASESGGGIVYGGKLTSQGIQEAYLVQENLDELPVEAPCLDAPQVTLVFDFFAGVGGLSRALQLARVKVDRLVVIEKDPDCRRLNAVRWPGCDVWSDIEKITKKEIERMMRSVPGITGVIAAGGSPCQGLSKLSCDRSTWLILDRSCSTATAPCWGGSRNWLRRCRSGACWDLKTSLVMRRTLQKCWRSWVPRQCWLAPVVCQECGDRGFTGQT